MFRFSALLLSHLINKKNYLTASHEKALFLATALTGVVLLL